MAIPRQEETNFDDPAERFLWAFRGMEYNGMPIGFPEPVLKEWSEHLSACGFIHIDQARSVENLDDLPGQEIHYQPPIRGQDHALNVAGKWVPVTQPIQEPVVPATSQMTPTEKAKLINELREEGLID
ncbi:DUF2744 domain-containing protein [Corynebacterium sp. NML120713]|uniref:phage gene 29 protein family protein n=1 Tax=Corynebacterium sp. NML120713 TaxID=1906332 RepID=UPI0008FB580F|nr:DUF2744 domain-containing protein [Corynebacterium sp. NML120713]OIR43213.1 hypothetical protein BJP06_06430 [Corynebacterium sp. NML120713]